MVSAGLNKSHKTVTHKVSIRMHTPDKSEFHKGNHKGVNASLKKTKFIVVQTIRPVV